MLRLLRFVSLAVLHTVLFTLHSTAQSPPTLTAETFTAWEDTTLTWPGYGGTRTARVRLFENAARDRDRRTVTVVLDDTAGNPHPITGDAPFLAEHVGRALDIDPTHLAFVFRFGAAAFAEDASDGPRGKVLTLRATFRRMASGRLSSPSWRVLSPEETLDYTDRHLR
ncbi:MAG: hypothetical protein AAFN13_14435 [Bacteroidota bacterium]